MNITPKDPNENWLANELAVLHETLPRSSASEQAGKVKFMAKVETLNRKRAFSSNSRRKSTSVPLFSIFKGWTNPAASTVIALIIALVLIFGGGAATVYASQQSLPDQALYPLKLLSEDILIKLEKDPQSQMGLNLQFASRRLDEINQQVQKGKTPDPAVVNRLNNELDDAVDNAGSLENADQIKPVVENLEKNLENHVEQLTRLQSQADPRAVAENTRLITMFQLRLKLAQQGIKDPKALRELMEAQKEQIKEQSAETAEPETTPETDETPAPQSSKVPENDQEQGKGQGKEKNNGNGPVSQPTLSPDQSSTSEPGLIEPTIIPKNNPSDINNGNNGNGNGNGNNGGGNNGNGNNGSGNNGNGNNGGGNKGNGNGGKGSGNPGNGKKGG